MIENWKNLQKAINLHRRQCKINADLEIAQKTIQA